MSNQIYTNQSNLNTSATVASISANYGTGFFFTSSTDGNFVAVEFNANSPLSADAISPALTAFNAANTAYALSATYYTSVSSVSSLSADALRNKNTAFSSVTSTTVTLTSTITNSFSAYTYYNTDGTAFGQLSSGQGTILIDRTYIGDIINLRSIKRYGFLGTLLSNTSTITLTANGVNSWGPENSRMRTLGYI